MDARDPTLSARGRTFADLYNEANSLFEQQRYPECERICHLLLSYPDLSDYHKAGCHNILSLGQDNFVWHAQQALDLYLHLYQERPGSSFVAATDPPPTHTELEAQQAFVELARKCLKKAEQDEKKIRTDYARQFKRFREAHGREPTSEELTKAHWIRYADDLEAFNDEYDAARAQIVQRSRGSDAEDSEDVEDDNNPDKMEVGGPEANENDLAGIIEDDDSDDDDFPAFKPISPPMTSPQHQQRQSSPVVAGPSSQYQPSSPPGPAHLSSPP